MLKKGILILSSVLVFSLLLCSCDKEVATGGFGENNVTPAGIHTLFPEANADVTVTEGDVSGETDATMILFSESGGSVSGTGASVSGSTVTLHAAGTYIVSGISSDGQIVIEAEKTDKVTLILNGLSLISQTSAPVYLKTADKLLLTLADGSVNYLGNGGSFVAVDENNVDAVIFAKDDITLDGEGTLVLESKGGHGIVGKDDVKIKSGTYVLSAANHGISAKDSLTLSGGIFTVTAGKDGIKAENEEDSTKGNILLDGACIRIISSGDGISAGGTLTVSAGEFVITAGGGAAAASATEESKKGVKSAGLLALEGGNFVIDSADDAFHTNASMTVSGGDYTVSTGDDGFHADEKLTVTGGIILVKTAYEGLEGKNLEISGGEISVTASDDGLNAGGGADGSGMAGIFGDRFGAGGAASSSSSILLSGGKIYVNAGGDGIDSNGTLTVSGGEVYVSGPTDSGNGALDFDGAGTVTGGTVIAVGSSGMVKNFGTASTQGSVLLSTGNQKAGTQVSIADANGNILASYLTEKAYSTVVISCPGLVLGGTYTVKAGTYSQSITLDSLIYGTGGMGGRPGGKPAPGGFGR